MQRLAAERARAENARTWRTPGEMAQVLDPTTIQTPALRLIDDELVRLTDTPDGRLIISMPPQEGKSQRISRRFPTWLLQQRPDTRIAVASYAHTVARRFGRMVRDDITTNSALLGFTVRPDLSAQNEWELTGHLGGMYAVGIGGALTSRPVDALVIDDPLKDREQADSPVYRDRCWDWWLEVGATRLAPGAPVVLVLTRWHEDDLAGRLLAAEDGHLWRVLNIPAQADHHPEAGETDPLNREPGQFLQSARGRTTEQWEAIKVRSGARTWASLYQGRPSPESGDVWQRQWWRRYITLPWSVDSDGAYRVDADEVIQTWDMAFKDTKSSDYVVGAVLGRWGAEVRVLDLLHRRLSFTDTLVAFKATCRKWPQATAKLVEDKANGTAVIDTLRREIGGIVPINPKESKYARATAVSPFIEAGNVLVPTPEIALFDVEALIDEAAAFPNGSHDDQVDAMSQGLARLLLQGQRRGRQMRFHGRAA